MAVIKSGSSTDQADVTSAKALKVDSSATTQPVSIAAPVSITGVVPTTQQGGGSGLIGDVQAKGVQGTNGIVTQDFKDSGRVIKTFSAQFTAAAAEALVSLTPVSDGTAGAASTSFGITAGKRFRIQAVFLTCFNITAAIHACQVNLRVSPTGAVTAASPIHGTVASTTAAATIGLTTSQQQIFPDGLELSGTMQFGISAIGIALAGQTVVVVGYEY